FFLSNATSTTYIHTLSLHDALPIYPAYRLRELEYVLTHSGVSVLVTARGFRSTDYVDMLTALIPELAVASTGPIGAERVPALRRSEEHTSELQSRRDLVCRLLLEKK